ncbi:hypothetical protein D3C81_1468130 [compost metagenome]
MKQRAAIYQAQALEPDDLFCVAQPKGFADFSRRLAQLLVQYAADRHQALAGRIHLSEKPKQ